MKNSPSKVRHFQSAALAASLLAWPRAASAQSTSKVVTLITGDRVIVSGQHGEALSIERASGREQVRFITQRVSPRPGQSPHWHVIPEDAVPLLAADKIDPRLFDVTLLIELEYDDAHRDTLPLIATYPQSAGFRIAATARSVPGAVTDKDLSSVEGVSAVASKARVREVWGAVALAPAPSGPAARGATPSAVPSEPIRKLWLDGLRRPVLDRSLPQIGVPAAWALGFEGDGVVVAVLDTGVDDTHPDLVDSVVASRNFTLDPDTDDTGHGTHVASILAGSGAAQGGLYRGVAPGAQLLAGKVCEAFGCPESSIIAGMQWAVAEEGARIVNMSLGGPDAPGLDPVEEAVNNLSADFEALFVISAGNTGPDAGTVESPGSAEAALTVGAAERDDQVAFFSSRGLTVGGGALKPDLTAPGVDIVAARGAGTLLGFPVGEAYVAASGTSMAAPHAAGAAALLLQQHPTWGAQELKAALMGSAAYNPTLTLPDQGAGRLEVAAALETRLLAEPASVSLGVARWPHEDDEPLTRTVSIRNLGAATDLTFELDLLAPDGSRPPSEMFIVTPATLSLAAGATGSVIVTANTRLSAPDGLYGGRLIASDGVARALAVPLAVIREEESYDLVVRQLDRSGAPTSDVIGFVYGYEEPVFTHFFPTPEAPETTLRLPPGRYALQVELYDVDGVEPPSIMIAPNQLLAADRVIEFDARRAEPISIEAPSPAVEAPSVALDWEVPSTWGGLNSSFALGTPAHGATIYYGATLEPHAPELLAMLDARWVTAGRKPAALYAGAWIERGRLPVGPVKAVDPRRLAVVQASYAAPLTSSELVNGVGVGAYPEGKSAYFLHSLNVALPHRRTEYYYTDDPTTRWVHDLFLRDEDFNVYVTMGDVPATYRAGRRYAVHMNEPPFSPVLPAATVFNDPVFRQGDLLQVTPSMYGDRHGHVGRLPHERSNALYRDGVLVPESEVSGLFELPPERANYRLEIETTQSLFELTTQAKTAWTFESAHVAGDEPQRLPLLTVRFDAELDERGQAPRGRRFRVPLQVARHDKQGPLDVREPKVEASFDDGATWAQVRVELQDKQWVALLEHPRGAEYASLRARVRDRDGNGVEQTLIRAYKLVRGH